MKLITNFFLYVPILISIYTMIEIQFTERQAIIEFTRYKLVEKSIPFFFLFIIIERILCYFYSKDYYRFNDSISSISMGTFQVLFDIYLGLGTIYPYYYLNKNYYLFGEIRLKDYSILEHILAFLFVEFGYYWFHRMAHEFNIGWATHITHHNSEEYNLTTALRQGSIQSILSFMYYLPFAFILPIPLFLLHKEINTVYQFWIHTRLINKFPYFIEYIFNTPSHHRVHHARFPYKYIDKNYGGTLIIFDRLFGSFQEEDEEIKYGVSVELNTWNIFYLQFHHFIEMFQVYSITKDLRTFFDYGPLYNYQTIKPIKNKNRIKYDRKGNNLYYYGIISSFFMIYYSLLFLKDYSWIHFIYIFIHMYSISLLFDSNHLFIWIELYRFIIHYYLFNNFYYILLSSFFIIWQLK